MGESVLNALMQLFAIIANVNPEGVSAKGRSIVETYLRNHVNAKLIKDYLLLFDNYRDFYKRNLKSFWRIEDDQASYQQAYKICKQINKSLHKNERIIVFLRLLEFVNEDEIVTPQEYKFIDTVSQAFNINEKEFDLVRRFVFSPDELDKEKKSVLIYHGQLDDEIEELEGAWIERNKPDHLKDNTRIKLDGFDGKLLIIHIASINNFFLRFYGDDNLQIDGNPIVNDVTYVLNSGSIIKGDNIESIYYNNIASILLRDSKSNRIIFTGKEISFRFKGTNNGVKPFSFSEESGQLIGVMGGSGVGKSTLLNVLNGNLFPEKGQILINNYDLHKDHLHLQGIIGFVPQDDLLFEELTVYQNLYYNAKLCFSNYTEQQIDETVDKILNDLDLADTRDLQVGNPLNKKISGGQRKRLNIGLELMREPSILFIDEPTSGLSSSDSEKIIDLLKKQTEKGKLVIANIHQPSSKIFKQFDKLWIIDKGGYPIYQGNPIDAIIYFKKMCTHVNAAESECPYCGTVNTEQILDIIEAKEVDEEGTFTKDRKIMPQEWYNKYKDNIESKLHPKSTKKILPRNPFNIPGIQKQFVIFMKRNVLSKIANRQYMLINFLEAPLLGFILAFFSKYIKDTYLFSENDNLPAYLLMSVIVALFMGLTVSAEEIIKDRKILQRESFLNLSWFSYLNSKIFILFLISAIQTFTFVVIGNLILEIDGMLLYYWIILFTTSAFANMIGLIISSGMTSVVAIYILIPFILVPQILLSGTIVPFDKLNKSISNPKYVPIVGDIMASRWAYEALAVVQYKENRYEKLVFNYDLEISKTSYNNSYLIPKIQQKLENCNRYISNVEYQEYITDQLTLVRNEIIKLAEKTEQPPFEYIDLLTYTNYNAVVMQEAIDYLNFIKLQFTEQSRMFSRKRDSVFNNLTDSLGRSGILAFKQKYHNNALTNWVLDRTSVDKIIETDSELIQKKDPIYKMPESNFGRAHFYAPYKQFNGELIDTVWFNVFVIWLGSFIAYIVLLLDLFKGIINYFTRLKLRKNRG
ncbi:MAG: ATP-binding cassette domain-containing protein [Bacteroidales bacterium]|jgi:ABC-type multidrug transport system ATPase subunit|nr:ATP-binding cassette domain-containing protein [Bacteroidales bacterium]